MLSNHRTRLDQQRARREAAFDKFPWDSPEDVNRRKKQLGLQHKSRVAKKIKAAIASDTDGKRSDLDAKPRSKTSKFTSASILGLQTGASNNNQIHSAAGEKGGLTDPPRILEPGSRVGQGRDPWNKFQVFSATRARQGATKSSKCKGFVVIQGYTLPDLKMHGA